MNYEEMIHGAIMHLYPLCDHQTTGATYGIICYPLVVGRKNNFKLRIEFPVEEVFMCNRHFGAVILKVIQQEGHSSEN